MLSNTYTRNHRPHHGQFMDPVPACFRRPSIKAILAEQQAEKEARK